MSDGQQSNKRRIFIKKGNNHYLIYEFIQEEDGSIYCWSPDVSDAKWLSYELTADGVIPKTVEAVGDGKLSLHATGMVAVRPHSNPSGHQMIIKGSHLLNRDNKAIGARHLFTAFHKEPAFQPANSPAYNRASDYVVVSSEKIKPFVLVFFAVPKQAATINFQFNLRKQDMERVPNDVLGMLTFSLREHNVFCLAYQTKHLDKWPRYTHFSYHNGHTVPIFIGTGDQKFELEFRQPEYKLVGQTLTISCLQAYPDA